MVSSSIDTYGIFQMPFFSIIIEEVLERIMTHVTTLETDPMFGNKRPEKLTSSSVSPLLLAGHETISVDVDDEENLWSLSFMFRLCLENVWKFRIWSSRLSS